MTQQMMDVNPYRQMDVYNNVPVSYYNNQQPMNQINFKSDKYSINAALSNTGLICGLGATAVGVGLGYYIYKKYFN